MAKQWTNHQVAHLRRWYGDKPVRQIAIAIGRTEQAVHSKAGRLGLKAWNGKFSKRRLCRESIKHLAESGLTISEIAERIGADRSSVRYVMSREMSDANQAAVARAGLERMVRVAIENGKRSRA